MSRHSSSENEENLDKECVKEYVHHLLKEEKVDLVIIMVPGLYPSEVLKTLEKMNLGVDTAVLRDNKIEFMKKTVRGA